MSKKYIKPILTSLSEEKAAFPAALLVGGPAAVASKALLLGVVTGLGLSIGGGKGGNHHNNANAIPPAI